MNEQDLINRLIQKDENGMSEFLKHYTPLMKYIISPILPNARDMEECVSEISMRIWERIGTYSPDKGSLTSWLTAVTRNCALNYKRRLHLNADEIPQNLPSNDPTPEESALKNERISELNRAVNSLSSTEKALFYRKYYYLQPISQIASEMHMTPRAVEGKLYRIKQKLRKMLGGEEHE